MQLRKRLTASIRQYIQSVSDASGRVALTPLDGDMVLQRDTDVLYVWNAGASAWYPIGGSTVPLSASNTNSITPTIVSNVFSASLNLSAQAASTSNKIVALSIQSDGLKGQILNSDIQAAAWAALGNTNSVNLSNNSGNLNAALNISSNAADVTYTKVALDIQGTGTVGLRAQIQNSLITGLFSSGNSALTYSNGAFTFVPGNVTHGTLASLTADDHTQYALLLGRTGGQTLIGGTASGNSLTLQSSSNATKGKILFGTSGYDEVNNRLGVGNNAPSTALDVSGDFALRHATDNATSGTLADVAAGAYSLLRFTAAGVVNSIAGGVDGKVLIIVNATGASMTVKNDSGGTAANRIQTGSGADIIMQANSALFLVYDSQATRWKVVGGAGGGGLVVNSTASISDTATIAASGSQRQVSYIQGNAAATTASATTPIANGSIDGQELTLIGRDDTNTVTIAGTGNIKMNGSATLGNGDSISFIWDGTNSAWLEIGRNH